MGNDQSKSKESREEDAGKENYFLFNNDELLHAFDILVDDSWKNTLQYNDLKQAHVKILKSFN